MATELWMNLPVKDLEKSKAFFSAIGFSVQTYGDGVQIVIGEQPSKVMLFHESRFKTFVHHEVIDPLKATEVLFSVGAESIEEVENVIERVKQAGGTVYAEPGWTDGWLYRAGFVDLDGHRWNMLHMDMEQMP